MPEHIDPLWTLLGAATALLGTISTAGVIVAFVAISRYAQNRDLTTLMAGTASADRAALIEAYGQLHPTEDVPTLGPLRRPRARRPGPAVTGGRGGSPGAPSSSGARPTRRET